MAAPATHIILSDSVFARWFPENSKRDFYLGTCFPDIRYLGILSRETTHCADARWNDLRTMSAFSAGLRFHSLVDQVREQYMLSHNVYDLFPDSPFARHALKFFEDGIVYHQRANWDEVIGHLETVAPEEVAFGVQETHVRRWHCVLQEYFSAPPTENSMYRLVTTMGRSKQMVDEIVKLLGFLRKEPKISHIIFDFHHDFADLICSRQSDSPLCTACEARMNERG